MVYVNDPKYCRYHRLVNHPLEKCFVLKEKIMELARQGKIKLNLSDDVDDTNMVTITFDSFKPTLLFDPPIIKEPSPYCRACSLSSNQQSKGYRMENNALPRNEDKDDEGWTHVTRCKCRTQFIPAPSSS